MNRMFNLILVLLMIGGVATVYDMKFQGTEAKKELAELEAKIADEMDQIALLRAEWALLNQPHRLEQLAKENADIFQLDVMRVDQLTREAEIAARLAEWTQPEGTTDIPDDAVDPIGLMALRAAAEVQ